MNAHIKKLVEAMELNSPATKEALTKAESEIGMTFPAQYKEFMVESNGAAGRVGENSYLSIWVVEEIVSLNKDAKVEEFIPGLAFFASDGGSTAYAFDKRTESISIVEIPDDSIHIEEAVLCGNTSEEFLEYLYNAG
jgi:hypothetical protein